VLGDDSFLDTSLLRLNDNTLSLCTIQSPEPGGVAAARPLQESGIVLLLITRRSFMHARACATAVWRAAWPERPVTPLGGGQTLMTVAITGPGVPGSGVSNLIPEGDESGSSTRRDVREPGPRIPVRVRCPSFGCARLPFRLPVP